MTRVNLVHPSELWDQHLLAELRELPRIPNSVLTGRVSVDPPATYRIGQGHVKFFTDKLCWLRERYNALYREAERRGFNVTYRFPNVYGKPDWTPEPEDVRVNREQIKARTPKTPRYYGVKYAM